jgi:hypothetical protein
MSLKVIGAGFGRTGTDSMREALEILGFGPCHHMRELIRDPEHECLWRSVVAGATPDWDLLLGGYASCVDWPSVLLAATGRGLPAGTGDSDMAHSRKLVGEFRKNAIAGHTFLHRNRGYAQKQRVDRSTCFS